MKKQLNEKVRSIYNLNEIRIFRAMMDSLKNIPGTDAIFVKETHGHAGMVEFISQSVRGNPKIKREIADLCIIINNTKKKEARITFLQAKYHRKSTSPFLNFSGDYFQWDLLKHRYAVASAGTIKFPVDILSFTDYRTISSYGVFYYDSNENIDMLFSIPDLLLPRIGNLNESTKATVLNFPAYKSCPQPGCVMPPCCTREVISTCDIDMYEKHLLDGHIGAPITSQNKGVASFIKAMLRNASGSMQNSEVIQNVINEFDSVDEDVLNNEFKGNTNLLIINTEGFNEHTD